jgi:hypothetical protein
VPSFYKSIREVSCCIDAGKDGGNIRFLTSKEYLSHLDGACENKHLTS